MNSARMQLHIRKSNQARVEDLGEDHWRLEIPAGHKGGYRLAQLDDPGSLKRRNFPWNPPLKLCVQARVSGENLPGTWGFGLWNDPFSFLIGNEGITQRLPALPEAAWFFHASEQNYLSFRDDLPANGFLAATFSSKKIATAAVTIASPALALALIPAGARLVRRQLRGIIQQDAASIQVTETDWHEYSLDWKPDKIRFYVDGINILNTGIVPRGPLSLVIWIDNQYAALPPEGRLRFGNLPNPEPAWLEIRQLFLHQYPS